MADFRVDDYTGTDQQRLAAAYSDAFHNRPSNVILPERELAMTAHLNVRPGVSIKAAGPESSVYLDFPGAAGPTGNSPYGFCILGLTPVAVGTLAAAADLGDDHLTLAPGHTVTPGMRLSIDNSRSGSGSWTYWDSVGCPIDPANMVDDRFRHDMPVVVSVDGNEVGLEHPLAHPLESGSTVNSIPEGGSTLEGFAIRGRDDGSFYRLLCVQRAHTVELNGLTFGVCGQSFAEFRDAAGITMDRCVGEYGGDNSWSGASAIYKVHAVDTCDLELTALTLGTPAHDHNQSFVTFNNVLRARVADGSFYGSQTYCLNTHGNGSREIVFERNLLAPGPNAKFGGVLLGNEAWGPDMRVVVRDNRLAGAATRFLEMRENCGNVVIARNEAMELTDEFVLAYAEDAPAMASPGSLKWELRRNRSNMPVSFGQTFGTFPYAGVADVDYGDNDMPDPLLAGTVERVTAGWADTAPAWA